MKCVEKQKKKCWYFSWDSRPLTHEIPSVSGKNSMKQLSSKAHVWVDLREPCLGSPPLQRKGQRWQMRGCKRAVCLFLWAVYVVPTAYTTSAAKGMKWRGCKRSLAIDLWTLLLLVGVPSQGSALKKCMKWSCKAHLAIRFANAASRCYRLAEGKRCL